MVLWYTNMLYYTTLVEHQNQDPLNVSVRLYPSIHLSLSQHFRDRAAAHTTYDPGLIQSGSVHTREHK
jgi:hypothetical protein